MCLSTGSRALYAGTFDLFTNGHLNIVERAAKLVDRLVVGVVSNPRKPGGMFRLHQRVELAKEAAKHVPNVEVQPVPERQYTGLWAVRDGVTVLVRGVRDGDDLKAEKTLARENKRLFGLETLMLVPDIDLEHVSSSFVKGMMDYDDWESAVAPYLPKNVLTEVMRLHVQ